MRILLVLFVVVPLAELYMLLWVSRLIGFWPTVAITLVTGIIGGSLAKREGLKVWRQWNDAVSQLRIPETGIVEGVLVLVGGVLLVTPGVLTDMIGFLLLFPASRRPLGRWLKSRVKVASAGSATFGHAAARRPSGSSSGRTPTFTVVDTSGETQED